MNPIPGGLPQLAFRGDIVFKPWALRILMVVVGDVLAVAILEVLVAAAKDAVAKCQLRSCGAQRWNRDGFALAFGKFVERYELPSTCFRKGSSIGLIGEAEMNLQ